MCKNSLAAGYVIPSLSRGSLVNYDWLLAQLDFWNPKCELVLTALDGLTRVMHPSFNDSRCTYYSSTMPGTPTTSQHYSVLYFQSLHVNNML